VEFSPDGDRLVTASSDGIGRVWGLAARTVIAPRKHPTPPNPLVYSPSARHVLVVKTPEAAASEELKRIDYSLKATGLDVLKGKAGILTEVDDYGNRVFRAPPARSSWGRRAGAAICCRSPSGCPRTTRWGSGP
jgi:hypothetical protein